jgi:hypothetical protein
MLAAAVFEGLFGVSLTADELSLTVRLGAESGRIHLYQPATDTFVAYRYESSVSSIVLEYDSNHPRPGRVALGLPPTRRAARVLLDAKPVPFRVGAVGRDRWVVVETPWGPHRLEAVLARDGQRTPR